MKVEFGERVYQVDTDDITLSQAMVITGRMGGNLKSWGAALSEGPDNDKWLTAVQCLYWLTLQQDGERVAIGDVDFPVLKFAAAFAAAEERENAPAAGVPADPTKPAAPPEGLPGAAEPPSQPDPGSTGSPAA
jgi:hypothetical protein